MRLSKIAGFTLIELLVVISIISLMSSVVLAGVSNAREKGVDAARVQTLGQIRSALELYYSDNKSYPAVPASGKIEDLINSSGPLSPYMKAVTPNFSVSGYTTKYSLNANGAWQLFVPTKTGGAFAKNNGCDSSEYTSYNSSNGGNAYCLSSSFSSGSAAAVYTPPPPTVDPIFGSQPRIFVKTRVNGVLDESFSGTCLLTYLGGSTAPVTCNGLVPYIPVLGRVYSVYWSSGRPSGVATNPIVSPGQASINPPSVLDIIFYVDF